jgi:BirA family biotin operon repressor/biotin-[acetyl-CoA-carboxylase] ligase
MAPLQPETILEDLGPSLFAKNMVFRKTLESTNTLAKELAAKGAHEGTLVLAEEQRAGRGRGGRRWISPGGVNLLFSVLLRPNLNTDQVFVLTMILALAAIEAIKGATGLGAKIKWPNDLYLVGKKLGGILTEFSVKGKGMEYVVLGLGLNVNWYPAEDEGIRYPATSLLAQTGVRTSRNKLLISILKPFEQYYRKVLAGEIEALFARWNELSLIIGKDVEIISGQDRLVGRVLRIDREGTLVIKDKKGREQRILSGDVSVRSGDGR